MVNALGKVRSYHPDDVIIREISLSKDENVVGFFILKDGTFLIDNPEKFFALGQIEKLSEIFKKEMEKSRLFQATI